jgi:NADPH:quinone reductase-like Zn-dependent oxidoreductase
MPSFKEYRLPKTTGINDLTLQIVHEVPKPRYHEVLVKIHAVSLNYRDLLVVNGVYPMGVKNNVIPCSDGAGEVIEVGEDVTSFKVGDHVIGTFNQKHLDGDLTDEAFKTGLGAALDGVLTQYKIFPEYGLVHMPAYLTFEEASTLPCAALTAWNALYGLFKLQPGETVLLEGTGGVSMFGLQIAHAAGATTIITSSSDDKLEVAKKEGATHVINYKKFPDWEKKVKELTNGVGVDHILEVGGPGTMSKSFESIRRNGHIVSIGFVAKGEPNTNVPLLAITKQVSLRGILVGSRRQFIEMNRAFEANNIKPVIDKVFPFEQAKEAFIHLEKQNHVGKVVIKVSE